MPATDARPYVRLFTHIGVSPEAARINALTGAALERALDGLSTWFVHLHGATSHVFPLGEASLAELAELAELAAGSSAATGHTTLATPTALEEIALADTLYGRRFERGMVLVNPGVEPQTYGSVTVPPRDAIFHMHTA